MEGREGGQAGGRGSGRLTARITNQYLNVSHTQRSLSLSVLSAKRGHWLRALFGAGLLLYTQLHYGLCVHTNLFCRQGESETGH